MTYDTNVSLIRPCPALLQRQTWKFERCTEPEFQVIRLTKLRPKHSNISSVPLHCAIILVWLIFWFSKSVFRSNDKTTNDKVYPNIINDAKKNNQE
jgi:hypothetical protein